MQLHQKKISPVPSNTPTPASFWVGFCLALITTIALIATLLYASNTYARESLLTDISTAWSFRYQSAPASPTSEVGFSPGGTAEALILKAIGITQKSTERDIK